MIKLNWLIDLYYSRCKNGEKKRKKSSVWIISLKTSYFLHSCKYFEYARIYVELSFNSLNIFFEIKLLTLAITRVMIVFAISRNRNLTSPDNRLIIRVIMLFTPYNKLLISTIRFVNPASRRYPHLRIHQQELAKRLFHT